jgi:hypothetical protein
MALADSKLAAVWPDGQITSDLRKVASSPKIKNISLYQNKKLDYTNCHPVPLRGAYHDRHERETGRGGRWQCRKRTA